MLHSIKNEFYKKTGISALIRKKKVLFYFKQKFKTDPLSGSPNIKTGGIPPQLIETVL